MDESAANTLASRCRKCSKSSVGAKVRKAGLVARESSKSGTSARKSSKLEWWLAKVQNWNGGTQKLKTGMAARKSSKSDMLIRKSSKLQCRHVKV